MDKHGYGLFNLNFILYQHNINAYPKCSHLILNTLVYEIFPSVRVVSLKLDIHSSEWWIRQSTFEMRQEIEFRVTYI